MAAEWQWLAHVLNSSGGPYVLAILLNTQHVDF
jgi:hypothetical protein